MRLSRRLPAHIANPGAAANANCKDGELGYRLVRLCRQRGIEVIAIPGANAAVTALAASGLPSDEFLFVGFLPSKKNARHEKLTALTNTACTMVLYEAPHRILFRLSNPPIGHKHQNAQCSFSFFGMDHVEPEMSIWDDFYSVVCIYNFIKQFHM